VHLFPIQCILHVSTQSFFNFFTEMVKGTINAHLLNKLNIKLIQTFDENKIRKQLTAYIASIWGGKVDIRSPSTNSRIYWCSDTIFISGNSTGFVNKPSRSV
jgi:hypothetical protein